MAILTLKCQVSFATGPLATPTWVDISTSVADVGFSTRRGRSNEFDTVQAGTAQITLDNRARLFDPTNASSTYYPNIVPGKQIRLLATWLGIDYPLFQGFVQSWQYQDSGFYGAIVVSCTDVIGTYFSRIQLGNETSISSSWRNESYPSSTNMSSQMGTQPGNRKITFAMPNLASGQTATIYISGTNGGGVATAEAMSLTYPTLITTSVNNYQFITFLIQYSHSSSAVVGQPFQIGIDATFPSEFSGFAIQSLLDTASWTQTDIAVGSTLIPSTAHTGTLLSAMNAVTDAENGSLFVRADGTVYFRGRYARITQLAQVALVNVSGTGGGLLPEVLFEKIVFDTGDRYLYNEIKLQAAGGVVQVARDTTSKDAYFLRTYSKSGLLIPTDTETLSAAQWLLLLYKSPSVRIAQVVVRGDLSTTPAWDTLLNRLNIDINTRVTVVWTPPGGGTPITQDALVEGIAITARRGNWTVTLSLSPRAIIANYLVMDDTTRGRVDYNAVMY